MDINNILCWIIPLITAIIGWLLRHLTCKGNNDDTSNDNNELELLKSKNAKLQADLDASLAGKKKAEHDLDLCLASKASLSAAASTAGAGLGIANSLTSNDNSGAAEPKLNFDAAAAKLAIGKKVVADDLKVVEGIGTMVFLLGINFLKLRKNAVKKF